MDNDIDVIFFHPAIRNYRVALFGYLNQIYRMHYFFTEAMGGWDNLKEFSHLGSEIESSLIKSGIENYTILLKKKYIPNLLYKIFKATNSILKYNPKLIILTNFISPFSAAMFLICRLLGKEVIFYDLNWIYPIKLLRGKVYLPLFKCLVKSQKYIITAGEKHKKFLISYGAKNSAINIAPTVCETPPADRVTLAGRAFQLRNNLELSDKKILLYMGRMVNYKAPDLLIKAFALYKTNNRDSNAALVICGDGPLLNSCKKLKTQFELTDVHILGKIPSRDRWEYFAMANIYILPSLFRYNEPVYCEGWGLGINEALSLDVPVVGTKACGGMHEIVGSSNEGGLMVEEGNAIELANAMEVLLRDDEYRKTIARKGKNKLEVKINGEIQRKTFSTIISVALNQI